MGKKSGKSSARGPTPQLRSRNTRSSRGRLLTDTASSNVLLTNQLRSLGLYAAHTIGDGNCLFRALSDQLYGSPSKHAELRQTICDWIEKHKSRYEPFVEDERGLDQHLRCMRENGTYGGHMELSAFAHLTKRNVKVIQPGLVYIIEWASGWDSISGDSSPSASTNAQSSSAAAAESSASSSSSSASITTRRRSTRAVTDKELDRRRRREKAEQSQKIRTGKHGYYVYEEVTSESEKEDPAPLTFGNETQHSTTSENPATESDGSGGTIYVAYHDWEHFSSIRNLNGPHTGLPLVCETPGDTVEPSSLKEREREAVKERDREKKKERKAMARGGSVNPNKTREGSEQPSASTIEKREPLKVKLKLSSRSSTVAPSSTATSTGTSPPLSSISASSSTSSVLTDLSATSTVVASNTPSLFLGDDPSAIPLPTSRSASPFPSALSTISSSSGSTSASSANLSTNPPYPLSPPHPAPSYHARQMHLQSVHVRTNRSPKRSFDESSGSTSGTEAEGGSASGREEKRTKRVEREQDGGNGDVDEAKELPTGMDIDLENSGSESGFEDEEDEEEGDGDGDKKKTADDTLLSLSAAGTSEGGKVKKLKPKHERLLGSGKPLTRRQRKALGLPKRGNGAGDAADNISAGKIVIPGGRWKGSGSAASTPTKGVHGLDVGTGEWLQNGSGRLDVRGFRELKI